MKLKQFIAYDDADYLILVIDKTSPVWQRLRTIIIESEWRPARENDWYYRVDPVDPDKKQKRHIHIAKKKHIKNKCDQVSWNDDGSRHDDHSFNDNLPGIERAKKIARKILRLPDDTKLEHKSSGAQVLTEAAGKSVPIQCIVFELVEDED